MKISKLIGVQDTREYVEDGDRFVPVPGSGVDHECDRCSRTHEVHAYVELEDGAIAIVGTGCMRADDMVDSKAVRAAASRASRLKRLEAELVGLEATYAAAKAIRASIPPVPAEQVVTVETGVKHRYEHTYGGQYVYSPHPTPSDERLSCLRDGICERAIRKAGLRNPSWRLGKIRDQIEKLTRAAAETS